MRIPIKQLLPLFVIYIFGNANCVIAGDKFSSGYGLSVTGDSNVGNAVESSDEQDDTRYLGELLASYNHPLGDLSKLIVSGTIGGEKYVRIEDLSNLFIAGIVDYEFSTSTEFSAPTFNLRFDLKGVDVESDLRDSINYKLGLDVLSRLSIKHRIGGGLLAVYNDADSEVFTTKDVRLSGRYKFDATDNGVLDVEYTYKYGDITSTGTPSLKIINASDAVIPDDAFGGLATNQLAYRLKANTHILRVGYNHFFSKHFSLDLSLMGIYSIATEDSDLTYERYLATARLAGSF